MVHGWQNNGYQKDLFRNELEGMMFPAGYGQSEVRLQFFKCTAPTLITSHRKHRGEFNAVHKNTEGDGDVWCPEDYTEVFAGGRCRANARAALRLSIRSNVGNSVERTARHWMGSRSQGVAELWLGQRKGYLLEG